MKNKFITLATLLLCSVFQLFSQSITIFNGYSYLFLEPLEYENGGVDNFGITKTVSDIFEDKGYGVVYDASQIKLIKELQDNPCVLLRCEIYHPTPNAYANSVTLTFYDCFNQQVYKTKGTGGMGLNLSGDFRIATRKALYEFRTLSYNYNPALTPKIEYPNVEQTNETEKTIKEYLSINNLDPIEGIYKSYQSEQMPNLYKIGIIRKDEKYKAIIIETDSKVWKQGEVKAIIEPSSMKSFYSIKWFMGNKESYETFGTMDNEALLNIEFKNPVTEEKMIDKFIKLFPLTETDFSNKKGNSKTSGSGFFMTTDGIIATNAHVIDGATNIEITVSNDLGVFTFKTKVLLIDSKNDVALIQVDDDKFKGLNSIPYGIVENSDVGSSVFTIGYPLNDIMGTNFKVTDGIISSTSGIGDDVRYYQISVPLQPGNSGGPLFNKEGNIIGITTSKLNSEAVGSQIENVNYAIKSSYLLNLYNMLPKSNKLNISSQVSTKELQEQVKIFKNYVCLIKAF